MVTFRAISLMIAAALALASCASPTAIPASPTPAPTPTAIPTATPVPIADLVAAADKALAEGKYADAERAYKGIVEAKPETAAAWVGLSRLYAEGPSPDGKTNRQLDAARKAVEAAPASADAQAALSLALLSDRQFDEAFKAANKAAELDEKSILARVARITMIGSNPSPTRTFDADAEAALALDPRSAAVFAAIGYGQRAAGDPGRALAAFRKAQEILPSSPRSAIIVIQQLLDMERFEQAESEAARLIARDPSNAEAHVMLAEAYLGQNRRADMEAALRKVDALAPDGYLADLTRVAALISDGETDKAIELARGVVKRAPGAAHPRAVLVGALLVGRDCAAADREAALLAADEPRIAQWLSAQGAAKLCAGDAIKALELFRKAQAIDPNNTAALFQQAALLYAQRRNADADALFVRAAEVAPAKSAMLMPPSNALDKETELAEVEAALVANPYDTGLQLQRAWLLVQLRHDDEALAQARAILSVKPDLVGARAVEGALRALDGDAEQALDILGKVLDAEPDQLEARLYSALSRMYLGRYSEASRDLLAYRSILQSRPGATVFSTASDISGIDTLRSYANMLDGAFAVDEKRIVTELDALSKQLGAMTFSAAFGTLSDPLGSGRVMTLTISLNIPASVSGSARLTTTSALQLAAAGIASLELARVTPNLAGGVLVFRDASGDIGHLRVTRAAAIQLTLGIVPANSVKPTVAWFRPVDPAKPPYQFAAGVFKYFDPLVKSLKTAEASPARLAEIWRERGAPIGADLEQRARMGFGFLITPTKAIAEPADLRAIYRPQDSTLYYSRTAGLTGLQELQVAVEYFRALQALGPDGADIDEGCARLTATGCHAVRTQVYGVATSLALGVVSGLGRTLSPGVDDALEAMMVSHAFTSLDYLPGLTRRMYVEGSSYWSRVGVWDLPKGERLSFLQSTREGQFKFSDPGGFRQVVLAPFAEALGGDWTEVDNETVSAAETRQMFSGMAGPRLLTFVASGAAGRYGFYRKAATGATLTVIRLGGNVPARNSAVRAALGYRRDLTETTSALYGTPDIRTWTSDKAVVLLRTSAGDSTLTLVIASDAAAAKEAEVAMMR